MISKEDVIADLLKEYETYGTLREKLAIQLEALGFKVEAHPTTLDLLVRATEGIAGMQRVVADSVAPKAN